MNIAGSGLFYSAEQELPSVGFRAVNEGYTQSYGVVDQRAEAVHLFGGDADVDRSIVDLMVLEACASQIEMKVRPLGVCLYPRGAAALPDRAHPLLYAPAWRWLVAPPQGTAPAGARP